MLVAISATGCGSVRELLRLDPPPPSYPTEWGKSPSYPNDNSYLDSNSAAASAAGAGGSYPPNPGVQAAGAGIPGYGAPAGGQPAQPIQLPPPTPLATGPTVPPTYPVYPQQPNGTPGQPSGGPGQPGSYPQIPPGIPGQPTGYQGLQPSPPGQPGNYPGMQPGAQGQPGNIPPGAPGYGMPMADPHVRSTPTAVGSRLELAPWEYPADRVVELTKQLETQNTLNRSLITRIHELETHGMTREQALAEAVRDVEKADEEVTRTRATLQLTREDAAALRARIQLMEKEDIETLRMVIAALEKLLDSPPRRTP